MVKGLTKWQIQNAKPLSLQQPDVHQEAQSGQSSPLANLGLRCWWRIVRTSSSEL